MSRSDKARKGRSYVAYDALLRGGSGKHLDRRTRRNRTRGAQLRTALRDA